MSYHQLSPALGLPDEVALLAGTRDETEVMLEPEPNGMGAWLVHVPPGKTVPAPRHVQGDGRFYVVVRGSMVVGDETLPLIGTTWTSPEVEDFQITAGPAGLAVLCMQYPTGSWEMAALAS